MFIADETNVGAKMLLQMGWNVGQGLGAKNEGNSESIKVRYKCDSFGLGFKDRNDQWTAHETDFDSLLQSLSANSTPPNGEVKKGFTSGESLEKKSKSSRARVHYKKFTKGKDLAQYTEKDLANIFGKKNFDVVKEVVQETSTNDEKFKNTNISIADYFKQKFESKQIGISSTVESSENDEVTGTENDSCDANNSEKITKKSKKGKKHKITEKIVEVVELEPKKKKKRKSEIVGEVTETVEVLVEVEDVPELKKKKNKDKQKTVELPEPEENVEIQEPEVKQKKKKSKKNFIEILPEVAVEVAENLDVDEPIKKKKKKKKSQQTEDSEAPAPNNVCISMKLKEFDKFGIPEIYQITSFTAEKFSNIDIDVIKNSSIENIVGYGLTEDFQLNVVESKKFHIHDESTCTDIKQQLETRQGKSKYHKYKINLKTF